MTQHCNPQLLTFHSPELSPHILRSSLLHTLNCPGHWAGSVRGRVTGRRIKQHTISDVRSSQFILLVIIFDINVQVGPAIAQVNWFGAREYRLPGSVDRASTNE